MYKEFESCDYLNFTSRDRSRNLIGREKKNMCINVFHEWIRLTISLIGQFLIKIPDWPSIGKSPNNSRYDWP